MGEALWMPPPCQGQACGCQPAGGQGLLLSLPSSLALALLPNSYTLCLERHPVGSQGIGAAGPRLWGRTSPGLIREQEGTRHPPTLCWGPWQVAPRGFVPLSGLWPHTLLPSSDPASTPLRVPPGQPSPV